MAVNPDYLDTMTFLDRSAEKGSVTIHVDGAALQATKDAYSTAVRAISDMLFMSTQRSLVYKDTGAIVGTGQREDKYLVSYHDTSNQAQFSFTIPGRNDTLLSTEPGTDMYSLLAGDNPTLAAFVTAFEAYAKSPDGNPVEVDVIRAVGRNI